MDKIKRRFRWEYRGYRLLETVVNRIPDGMLPAVAGGLAFLAFRLLKIRRRVSLDNLRIAFPEKTEYWRRRTAYASYRHFALLILEFMKLNSRAPRDIRALVRAGNRDTGDLRRYLSTGKGVVLVSGHFGNWEMGIAYLNTLGFQSAAIQQRQKNPLVNERMKRLREKWGMEIIYPRGAVNNCVRAIREGKMAVLLGDQDAGQRGIFVPFFNRLSSTPPGAAAIALKSGAPLYFAASVRTANNRFRITVEKIAMPGDARFTPENVRRLTAGYTAALEQWVRRYPEQYFWMHRRWKTPPPATSRPEQLQVGEGSG